jgi:hypothetical protein
MWVKVLSYPKVIDNRGKTWVKRLYLLVVLFEEKWNYGKNVLVPAAVFQLSIVVSLTCTANHLSSGLN